MALVKITDKDFYCEDSVYWKFYRCPKCNKTNVCPHFQHCPHCGVELFWEITEEAE